MLSEQSGAEHGSLQALILHSHNRGASGEGMFVTMDLIVVKEIYVGSWRRPDGYGDMV